MEKIYKMLSSVTTYFSATHLCCLIYIIPYVHLYFLILHYFACPLYHQKLSDWPYRPAKGPLAARGRPYLSDWPFGPAKNPLSDRGGHI